MDRAEWTKKKVALLLELHRHETLYWRQKKRALFREIQQELQEGRSMENDKEMATILQTKTCPQGVFFVEEKALCHFKEAESLLSAEAFHFYLGKAILAYRSWPAQVFTQETFFELLFLQSLLELWGPPGNTP